MSYFDKSEILLVPGLLGDVLFSKRCDASMVQVIKLLSGRVKEKQDQPPARKENCQVNVVANNLLIMMSWGIILPQKNWGL